MKTRFKEKLHKFGKYLLDILFPTDIKCIFCHEELDNKEYNKTCLFCYVKLPTIDKFCPRCGAPVSDNNTGVCTNCKINNYHFTSARSVFQYKDEIVRVIHDIKYKKKKHYIPYLANYMCEVYATSNIFADYITSVPLHPNREKSRGFNQARLLAECCANRLGLPYIDMTTKVKDNVSQTTLNYKDRVNNVKDAYKFNHDYKPIIHKKTILIIDDLLTTGSTVSELSKVILKAGASKCYVLTLAHGDTDKLDSKKED